MSKSTSLAPITVTVPLIVPVARNVEVSRTTTDKDFHTTHTQ